VYFVVSAVFHYLGPSFAVLLFARVPVLGVAWLRIASAAVVFALWRRPWRALRRPSPLIIGWGATLAAMNCCFYEAIDRLPLGTVAAIEFLPVIALAAIGARVGRNLAALALAVAGVGLLSDVQLSGQPLGFAFALANAALFALYIVLAHRASRHEMGGIDGLGAAMLVAAVLVTPVAGWQVTGSLGDPVALLAGVGVGISSSVIPYVTDQLAMARLSRATYALMVALLPATAVVVGVIVLGQLPSGVELLAVGLVIAGVAIHRDPGEAAGDPREAAGGPGEAAGDPGDAAGDPGEAAGDPGEAAGGPGEAAGDSCGAEPVVYDCAGSAAVAGAGEPGSSGADGGSAGSGAGAASATRCAPAAPIAPMSSDSSAHLEPWASLPRSSSIDGEPGPVSLSASSSAIRTTLYS
jgi:inner membrane transporter RhtA